MGFTKPIEQLLLSYQGTINVSEIYYTRRNAMKDFEENKIVEEEAKENLAEIVEYLHDPAKYQELPLPVRDQWVLFLRKDDKLAQQETITAADFCELGLLGGEHSEALRKKTAKAFHLGHGSAKTLRQSLNKLGITKEELENRLKDEQTDCQCR